MIFKQMPRDLKNISDYIMQNDAKVTQVYEILEDIRDNMDSKNTFYISINKAIELLEEV